MDELLWRTEEKNGKRMIHFFSVVNEHIISRENEVLSTATCL